MSFSKDNLRLLGAANQLRQFNRLGILVISPKYCEISDKRIRLRHGILDYTDTRYMPQSTLYDSRQLHLNSWKLPYL